MLTASQCCGQCGRFGRTPLDKPGDSLIERGFGRCALMPAWQFLPERSSCQFNPSQFQARPA